MDARSCIQFFSYPRSQPFYCQKRESLFDYSSQKMLRVRLVQLVATIQRRGRYILLIIIGLVIVLGTIYSIYLGDALRYLPDEADYYALARNIAHSRFYSLDSFSPTAFRPPGYPLFLSLFYLLGARVVILRLLNFIILGISIYLVYKILGQGSSTIAAIIGASLAALYPVNFYSAGTLYPQTLATSIFLGAIYLLVLNKNRIHYCVLCGLLAGMLILTIPTFVFISSAIGVWYWLYPGKAWGRGLLVALAISALVIGAWTLRNYTQFNTVFFVSTNSGKNLLLGNSENTTPNGGTGIDISRYVAQASKLSEIERDRFFRDQAINYILSHKLHSIKLYLLKFLNYFNYRNELVTQTEASTMKDILMLISYGPLLLAFIIRLFFSRIFKLSSLEVLFVILYLGSALLSALFFTRIRFRVPFDFLLIMLVAIFIERIIQSILEQRRPLGQLRYS